MLNVLNSVFGCIRRFYRFRSLWLFIFCIGLGFFVGDRLYWLGYEAGKTAQRIEQQAVVLECQIQAYVSDRIYSVLLEQAHKGQHKGHASVGRIGGNDGHR